MRQRTPQPLPSPPKEWNVPPEVLAGLQHDLDDYLGQLWNAMAGHLGLDKQPEQKFDRRLEDRLKFQGIPISIENAKGSYRDWTDERGNKGRTLMIWPYGYIRRSEGADGDHVDCYVGPNADAPNAYIIRQTRADSGEPDEDKVMLGFNSAEEARQGWGIHHTQADEIFGGISECTIPELKEKLKENWKHPGFLKAGTSEGAMRAWDTRGRGRAWEEADKYRGPLTYVETGPDAAEGGDKLLNRKDYAKYADRGMTQREAWALAEYQSGHGWAVLSSVRDANDGKAANPQHLAQAKLWYGAMQKLDSYDGTTYRGVNLPTAQAARDYLKAYTPGATVEMDNFMPSSKVRSKGEHYAKGDIGHGKGEILFKIQSAAGRDIAEMGLAGMVDIREVVHLPGAKFEVGKVSEKPTKGGGTRFTVVLKDR